MSDNIPPSEAVTPADMDSGSETGEPAAVVPVMSPQITAEDVEANRLRNVMLTEEQKSELKSMMKLEVRGLLTPEEFAYLRSYGPKFFDKVLNMPSLKLKTALHQPLRELMEYSAPFDCSGDLLYANLFKHYCPNPTKKQFKGAVIYTWAQSVFFGIYFPLDDWVDEAPMRRFRKAYHLEVGCKTAIMRIFVLFQAITELLTVEFGKEPFGAELVQRFAHYATLGTGAQLLDAQGHKNQDNMWDLAFRREHNIAMGTPLSHMPLEIAAVMTGYKLTSTDLDLWTEMMADLTMLIRNTNDLTDVYPKNPTGKMLYTDIAVGAGSWCSGTAWKLANDQQKQVLKENYGSKKTKKIAKVLQVYQDVNLKAQYTKDKADLLVSLWPQFAKCPDALAPKKALMEIVKFYLADHQMSWM